MSISYKALFTKIAQNEADNLVKSADDKPIVYMANFSDLFTGSRTIAMSKPLLSCLKKLRVRCPIIRINKSITHNKMYIYGSIFTLYASKGR